jgi:NADH dehydrogenase
MSQPSQKQRIVILGGGFAGVYAAKTLEKMMSRAERESIEITLVTSENYMVFQPLLPEVISGMIETLHCICPIRRLLRHTRIATRSVEAIDLESQTVRLAPGFLPKTRTLEFDHLVVCLGMRLNYSLVPGMKEHAIPFKYLGDALRLRNQLVRALEEADIETDPEEKQRLLTVVVAGGGFSGVECIAEIHDFLRRSLSAYRNIRRDEIRCVLLQSADRILPELPADLAEYAHQILSRRGVDIRLDTRLKAVSNDAVLTQAKAADEPLSIPARTVVTTVPAAPDPLLSTLDCLQDRGRIEVNEFMQVVDNPRLWSLGDCAAVPQRDGITSPPTAQHAVRQAKTCATNILAAIRGTKKKPFAFTGLGKLASLGRGSAVAEVFGMKLRGVVAWLFWRAVYLSKVPGFDRKVRIAMDWTLDLILPRDITQLRIFESAGVQHQHFHAGERVFDAGDVGDQLFVIVTGTVEVVIDGTRIAELTDGDVFGEIALVSHQPRNARVVAKTDADLIAIPRDDFHELVTHLPGVKPAIEEIMKSHGVVLPAPRSQPSS